MLLSGHLASIAPYRLEGSDADTDYWIDATGDRGLSGGPVCNMSGGVIGIVTSGQFHDLTSLIPDMLIPHNIMRALPLSERKIGPARAACEALDLSTVGDGGVSQKLNVPAAVRASVQKKSP
jgi:hypothetical protein